MPWTGQVIVDTSKYSIGGSHQAFLISNIALNVSNIIVKKSKIGGMHPDYL
jgi:hypothetical protein